MELLYFFSSPRWFSFPLHQLISTNFPWPRCILSIELTAWIRKKIRWNEGTVDDGICDEMGRNCWVSWRGRRCGDEASVNARTDDVRTDASTCMTRTDQRNKNKWYENERTSMNEQLCNKYVYDKNAWTPAWRVHSMIIKTKSRQCNGNEWHGESKQWAKWANYVEWLQKG